MNFKVLMICTVELDRNGITTWILNYSRQLCLFGNKVDVLSAEICTVDVQYELEKSGCSVKELSPRKENTITYFHDLIKLIKKEKYDIVHIHGNSCTMAIELLAAFLGGCKVRVAHSHNTSCEHKKAHMLLRPVFELFCNGRVACGKEAGKWLFKGKNFYVANNGIETDKYIFNSAKREAIRKKLNIADNSILLGHIGAFNKVKNQEFLINLLSDIDDRYKLICIGDGENKQNVENMAESSGLSKNVIFTGNVNNVPELLQAIDIFLLPSLYEGFPFVMVEAQASGLPCIVSDAVSKESNLTGDVLYLPLDKQIWTETVLNISCFEKSNMSEIIKNSGYDIASNAKELICFYKELFY